MHRSLLLAALLASAAAQFTPGTCNKELSDAAFACAKLFPSPSGSPADSFNQIASPDGHLRICYGDVPECNDLQRLALTPAGDCTVLVWKGGYVNLKTVISPCPNPLPPRLQEKRLCTATGLIASEFYGRIYTDIVRNNANEVFLYNVTAKTLVAKSNGQCLVAVPGPPHPYLGYGGVMTVPCQPSAPLQQWTIQDQRVAATTAGMASFCLDTNPFQRGSGASVGPCNMGALSTTTFVECASLTTSYITIKTLTTGHRLSEYYTSLYANAPADNFNELFTWDKPNKMFKVASNNQCLDAYKDANGKFQVHTWACDVKNGNQKWNFNPTTKTLEHATHTGQCLDADPTYTDRHAQMWACIPNNPNQQWSIDTFYG
ncbi:hypothetical protein SPRG_20540 [Saprolegnia parasitica CBS 223.65]|uniref:Ricin B lectin domain-containing protein n=1 Tax=Saprolegnia parasitica (strain CBS 223.65) TaxID=695850 RepID=A0A067CIY1_SAPPC|nr:hypothetical protein SPRG_20540 [Saprolegnia parasitica CBS 223.65]KDO26742.1 hypothetical protein SPRG_20540 [Saprolegnia parasitica CBS 223.65]|eukprot:XP_012202622.1 hypothetical protein SPRG_20540 [Saprolegnia parasitica CBS 223.65]